MRLQHVIQQQFRRLSYRAPILRHVSITTTLLSLIWIYAIYWGERSVYHSSVEACAWEKWEEWPQEASPHHLVLIADPQLVDPHTYPGRPWPLSTMTERYTDLYMMRNFRLINANFDPDSIFFLGDLFDGGREWPPENARIVDKTGRKYMEEQGVLEPKAVKKRSMGAALSKPHANSMLKEDHNIGKNGEDLKAFIPGGYGKFAKYGSKQWYIDLDRFAKIFYDPAQVYPDSHRQMLAAYDVAADATSVANGATGESWQEYATSGGKSRKVVASLPGNHDVGFGAGVQLSVRERFESHFGASNRVDVVGNHTIISIDSPSLSAHSQYLKSGWESEAAQSEQLDHIWQPTWDYLDNIDQPVGKAVSDALHEYFPESRPKGWSHEVVDPEDAEKIAAHKAVNEAAKKRPHLPVILLTHVPLFRNPDTDCGPMRERGNSIKVQFGYQYQNVVTQTLSKDIVHKVSAAGDIIQVFSGDDHDYCDVTHRYNVPQPGTKSYFPNDDSLKARYQQIKEITVKSFSWAMGVRKPGFLLVSLWNPVDAQGKTIGTPLPTIQIHNCLLPDQLSIFINYGLLFLITFPLLLTQSILRIFRTSSESSRLDAPPSDTDSKSPLPRFQFTNGSLAPASPTHQRGTSSTSSHSTTNPDTANPSVQRNTTARARSVSPGSYTTNPQPSKSQPTGGLIDKAGFFPAVKWIDPADEESDEESIVGVDGVDGAGEEDDSQAKWKWRQRTRTPWGWKERVRRVGWEFGLDLVVVVVPAGGWYFWLIGRG
ncbi:uncharacterized protein LTR77_003817 [Saxophila tyrrhenica]|uniref:Calcineurin-like phosphoesterase domain-containing protein n=1 Tax=Saxophila tyrrhenica TaxID=1690608 RepID=A0AAV9PIZ6_9PEZI|nr:hypothetical protein LTR77_003817 [Saxophila tyrrhenica]